MITSPVPVISRIAVAFYADALHYGTMTVTLYKDAPDGGKIQYYSLHDQQHHLFDDYAFTAVWGTDLNHGRSKLYTFRTRREMGDKFRELIRRRQKDGYRLLYTFSRDTKNDILSSIVETTAG